MNTKMMLLPLALLLGACDNDQPVDAPESADAVEAREAGGHRGKLAKLDVDGDGAISLAEARGHRIADKFAELDGNTDGKLTHDELAAMKHGDGHGKDPAERAEKMMSKLDADRDGAISKAEVEGHRFADKFAAIDANSDGKVTREELVAFKRSHHGERGDWHGKDPAERAERVMNKLDADRDGAISKTEVEGHRFADKFAEIDANSDGKVTREELLAFKRSHHGKHGKHGKQERG